LDVDILRSSRRGGLLVSFWQGKWQMANGKWQMANDKSLPVAKSRYFLQII
jgi:hypothetical protein